MTRKYEIYDDATRINTDYDECIKLENDDLLPDFYDLDCDGERLCKFCEFHVDNECARNNDCWIDSDDILELYAARYVFEELYELSEKHGLFQFTKLYRDFWLYDGGYSENERPDEFSTEYYFNYIYWIKETNKFEIAVYFLICELYDWGYDKITEVLSALNCNVFELVEASSNGYFNPNVETMLNGLTIRDFIGWSINHKWDLANSKIMWDESVKQMEFHNSLNYP